MIQVVKSSGVSQQFIPEKLLKVLTWASEGTSIDPYSIYEKVKPYIRDGISSKELQQNVIKVAASSISIEEPDYQFVASNLAMFALRKEVYGQFDAPSLLEQISVNVGRGVYDKEILQKYSIDEIDELDNYIDHSKDFTFSYAGTMQLKEKYLVKDRSSNKIFETPQFSYILIAMCLHQEEKENRLDKVKAMYDALANKQISLPTPIMAGVRTPTRQFSSCVVIEGGDSLNGINKAANSIIKYISKRAGIGVNAGMIRAEGSKIGAGEVRHTGVIPFWKHLQTAVKSCLTPNTLVWTLVDGKEKETQVQYIKVGDKIKSFENRKVTFKEVTDVWETVVEHDRQVDLYFSNGSIINCSTNHPIMVYSGDEVIQKYPLDLTDNDMIVGENGFITYLSKVEKGNHSTRYIDITVADTNVFFASSNGLSSVLTHNCSQGGIRGGAATLFYPMWHLEVENLLVLKNNRGVEENRIRHLDYGVQINDLMINRLLNDSYITLFSPDVENGQLYDLYFRDKQAFTEMYERLEKSDVRKKRIKASDLFELFMTERANTARIYPYFVDNVGDHGTFDRFTSPVKQSNLCLSGDSLVDIKIDGKIKTVSMIQLNELFKTEDNILVKSYDTSKESEVWSKVTASALMNKSAKVIGITMDSGAGLICTPDHKIYANGKWVEAKELAGNSKLVEIEGNGSIEYIEYLDTEIPVYDITVEDTHCFFANDILVHNCLEIAIPTEPLDSKKNVLIKIKKSDVLDFYKKHPDGVIRT